MSRSQPNMQPNGQNNGPARTQSLIITAITLFALSGLIIGFAVGAVTRPTQAVQPTPTIPSQTVVKKNEPTAPPKVTPQRLGCPVVDQADADGIADGSSTYSLQAHVIDSSGGTGANCFNGKPIQTSGITCRLWLSKQPDNDAISKTWKNVDSPQPGEVENGLAFQSATPQTQKCNSQGQASWKFSVSPDVKHGSYFLVVLTDWDGQYGNWSWRPFNVKKAN